MTPRRDAAIVLGVCFLPLMASAAYVLMRGDRAAVYTTPRMLVMMAFELLVGIGGILYLRWRRFPLQTFRVRLSMDAIVIGGFLGLLLIPFTGFVYGLALRLPLGPELGVHDFRDTAPFLLTLLFLVINSWFEESFILALPRAAFPEWRAPTMIFLTSLLRTSYHMYQGPAGLIAIFACGALLALVYWRTRDLAIPIVAHTVMNAVLSALRH